MTLEELDVIFPGARESCSMNWLFDIFPDRTDPFPIVTYITIEEGSYESTVEQRIHRFITPEEKYLAAWEKLRIRPILRAKRGLDAATIKERVILSEVVAQYFGESKKKYGAVSWFSCTRHGNDTTASLKVDDEKGLYFCFGCSDGSDVIGFVMRMESLDFPSALKVLAATI